MTKGIDTPPANKPIDIPRCSIQMGAIEALMAA